LHVAQIRPASAGTVYNGGTAIVTVSEAGFYRQIKPCKDMSVQTRFLNLTGLTSEIGISGHLKVGMQDNRMFRRC